MSEYFSHGAISNSDLKRFKQNLGLTRELPVNLEAIFAFGSLFHKIILEPNLITSEDRAHADFKLAERMKETLWKDSLCRDFIMASDFHREFEVYDTLEVGGMQINARCKADGIRTGIRYLLELKGLNVSTERAFNEALVNFDYDQAAVHYMLTAKCDVTLIAGISKKKDVMFKRIIKKHDDFYATGEQKLIDTLKLLITYSPSDVTFI